MEVIKRFECLGGVYFSGVLDSSTLNSCDINTCSIISSSLLLPDSSLTILKIKNLNTCLNSLSNNKHDNLLGLNNVSIYNGFIDLSYSIATTNAPLTNLDVTVKITATNVNLGNLSTSK